MQLNKSVLLNSSAGSDVQYVGGEILIQGLEPIKQSRVVDFSQINYKAEVPQVVTVGSVAYTPTAATNYAVLIGDTNRRVNGQIQPLKKYSYTTPDDVLTMGASAALQREAITGKLVDAINADGKNYCVAVTLGSGNGFTITDDAGYFPYNRQGMTNRMGANTVRVVTNTDGTGFGATNIVNTTAAVYAVGVGATLANNAPVYDFVTGNLISGEFDAPKTIAGAIAVSGQKYNCFSISYLSETVMPTIAANYKGFILKNQTVWVDNGAGSSVTNLAGYISFERQIHRGLYNKYAFDASAQVDFLDNVILFQGAAGAVPTATGANKMVSDAKWTYTQIGSQTLTTPTPGNDGLILDQDLADTEGAEYTPSLLTSAPQEFVVGKTDFSVFGRIKAGDWMDAAWQIGFHTKAAHSSTFAYSNLASVGTLAAAATTVVTNGILASAALVSTSTAITPTNAAYLTVEVLVNKAGVVTCKLNDVTYPVYSVGTTPLVFTAGTILIPFVRYANVLTGDPDLVLNEIAAVPAIWKY